MKLRICTVVIALQGCIVPDLQLEGRYCSSAEPCAEGYACVKDRCRWPIGADGPASHDRGTTDLNGTKDLSNTLDTLVRPDGPNQDQLVVPDGGCPKGFTQCGAICADLKNDPLHCNGCNKTCGLGADQCVAGVCKCGNQPACGSSLNCVAGACKCVTGLTSRCNGCCDTSNVCQPGTSTSSCGANGAACQQCSAPECNSAICGSGKCNTMGLLDGTPCGAGGGNIGKCQNGTCCKGCWNSTTKICDPGTSTSSCGVFGNTCKACSLPPACQKYVCQGGNCQLQSLSGTICNFKGKPGRCEGGICCTGCWNKMSSPPTCEPGNSIIFCGTEGETCVKCNIKFSECSPVTFDCIPIGR